MRKWPFMAARLPIQICHFIWAFEADEAFILRISAVQWVLMSEGAASVLVQLFFSKAQLVLEAKLRRRFCACLPQTSQGAEVKALLFQIRT